MGAIVETADGEGGAVDDIEHLRDLASEAPVIRLVNLVIQRAVELRASDIHVEPFESRLKVRYRVDGVLVEGESPPANLTAAVISRIKIMARSTSPSAACRRTAASCCACRARSWTCA
jgi:general secretion pathway protein E